MSSLPLSPADGGGRYPGFRTLDQSPHWDAATTEVVLARVEHPPGIRFFAAREQALAQALFDLLLAQTGEPRVPVLELVDARLADGETDGWHYDGMDPDPQAWRATLAALDDEARAGSGSGFVEADADVQRAILQRVQAGGQDDWHGYPASHVWSLWTRYACTAFYSHPWAWDEIGFPGPAYPRGYKNLGVDRPEPFEVPDAHPAEDPVTRGDRS